MQKTDSFFLLPWTVLHMKYRINSVIGQGGFGITYDGTDLKLDMHVAIKEYFPHSMADRENTVSLDVTCTSGTRDLYEKGMKNFLTEAKNMARYAGEENFVAVHDYFAENNTAYIVMEFIEGQNLKQYLKNYGRLTMNQAMPIIMPVMNTLEKIHERHMIHRDISPSNIMILPDGRVRLLDFGAAKEISMETVDMSAMSAVFKRGYSPIEQLTYGMKQGPYTDIYALCATIYEMLTLCTPPSPLQRAHEGEVLIPPSQLGAKISPVQEAALLKGLEINGADRIQSIWELRAAFCEGDFGYDRYEGGGAPRENILTISLIAAASILLLILAVMAVSSRNLYKPGCDTSSRDFCRSFCVASSQSLYLPFSGYNLLKPEEPSSEGTAEEADEQTVNLKNEEGETIAIVTKPTWAAKRENEGLGDITYLSASEDRILNVYLMQSISISSYILITKDQLQMQAKDLGYDEIEIIDESEAEVNENHIDWLVIRFKIDGAYGIYYWGGVSCEQGCVAVVSTYFGAEEYPDIYEKEYLQDAECIEIVQ